MYARATIAVFQPGQLAEATDLFRRAMLPHAQTQPGFRGALALGDAATDKGIIITLWETEADLAASAPPDAIRPQVERFGDLIADASQSIYEVLLQLSL